MNYLSQYTKAVWIYAIHHILESEGIDPDPLFSEYSVELSAFSSVREDVSRELVNALWLAAKDITGDDALCLKAVDFINEPFINALSSVSQASATIRQALSILQRFHTLISPELRISIDIKDHLKLSVWNVDMQCPWFPEDTHTTLAIIAKHGFAIAANEIKPIALHLSDERPANHTRYGDVFNCDIFYGKSEDCLIYPLEVLDLAIPSSDPQMFNHFEGYLESHLKRKEHDKDKIAFNLKVENYLTEQLGPNFPTLTRAAEHAHMSVSAFKKHLQAEQTTYQQIADRVRQEHACQLLQLGHHSIKEIAYQLGFSNSSAFNRAFRRWKGLAPSEYLESISSANSIPEHRSGDLQKSLPNEASNQLSCAD